MSDTDTTLDVPPLSIVVMDDDADFREFLMSELVDDGHGVRSVATTKDLIEACDANLPDILLLDMKMGDTTGEEVLEVVRERWSKLCVIVVTGYPSMESMRETFKKDVFDYIAKPFEASELRRCLAQAAKEFDLGGRPQDRLRIELGRLIRLARTERSWTLKELGEASGVSVSQLSSIERGSHLPSIESLLAVAGALECKPSDWLHAAGF